MLIIGIPRNGIAYGFFYCRQPKGAIEAELPDMRGNARTPSGLVLKLTEGVENIRGDSGLMAKARDAREDGCNYALEGIFPGGTNRETAEELVKILMSAHQSDLYKPGEPFRGGVIFLENGQYEFME